MLADAFSNRTKGILPTSSDEPEHYQRSYTGGEYRIAIVDPKWDSTPLVRPAGSFANIMASTDVRLVGGPAEGEAQVGAVCRWQSNDPHYRLTVARWSEHASLIRDDGMTTTTLLFFDGSGVIHLGNAINHLDLQCVGDTIAGFVNGRPIGSVRDQTYRTREVGLTVDWEPSTNDRRDARFSNLVLYRFGSP